MKIQIVARNLELTSSQRELIERRIGFALGRFGRRIDRVAVRFADVNGPRGGVDTRCQIMAGIVPKGQVRVEVTDVGIEVAISRAADRLSRRVSSELERRRATKGTEAARYADGTDAAAV